MKCYNHPERDAVSTCSICGVGLCKECTDRDNPRMCDECFENTCRELKHDIRQEHRRDVRGFYLTALIGIALVLFCYPQAQYSFPENIMVFLVIFTVPFAIRGIRRFFPGGGCLLTLAKFFVAWFLGVFSFVWQLFRTGKEIRKNQTRPGLGLLLELLFVVSNILIPMGTFLAMNIAFHVLKSKLL